MKIFSVIFFSFVVIILLESCSSSVPTSTQQVHLPQTKPQKIFTPEGWSDITSKSKSQDVLLWLVDKEYTATILVKELRANESSVVALAKEELCVLGNVSLRMKLANENFHRLVTRMPALFGEKQNVCSYIYSENGLLRRVMVFRKNGKVYESELALEKSSAEFDKATEAQIASVALFVN